VGSHVRAGARINAGRESRELNAEENARSRQIDEVIVIGRVKLGPEDHSGFVLHFGALNSKVYILGGSVEGIAENDSVTV
jgi:hypothetical protein